MREKKIPSLADLKSECCGCGVCSMVCPVQAIEMKEDNEGFLYPYVDNIKCIGCMQCKKSCVIKVRREDVAASKL